MGLMMKPSATVVCMCCVYQLPMKLAASLSVEKTLW
jgi:hypothetical protein